jgi:hypothetical protein
MVDEILLKQEKAPKIDRYSFACTETQKIELDELKNKGIDINEMFRRYAQSLIDRSKSEPQAG